MKKSALYILVVLMATLSGALTSCSDFDPKGAPEVPFLAKASDVQASVSGRTVTLSWNLPSQTGITGVRLSCDNGSPIELPAGTTSYSLKGQPMEKELVYTVKVVYDGKYVSEGESTTITVPYVASKIAFLLTADSPSALPDDDEQAAAEWFAKQPNAEFIHPEQIAGLDPDIYSVIWVMVDRKGLPMGWENLPAEFSSTATINALKTYSINGGALYLSNMATQLTVPLGIVPDTMAPTVFSSGDGGNGGDVWTINPYLGWDFRDGSDQGFYDRTVHDIYKGLKLEDPNGYGYDSLPLIGPGEREDHNCLWDCNLYGRGAFPDVIRNFEDLTDSMVLATWGHVRDHCVAGLVEFFATSSHGKCIANGFAAYEWNQNSGTNIYQHNIEQLTSNILSYLQ